jgi:shikimate dehydrogenase
LKAILARVRTGEIAGLNVTIPHKQNVIPLLDDITPTARTIGAVNTISMQNGKLIGANTDAPGFLTDLHSFVTMRTRRKDKNALVLGAGGAARAITYALVNDGWNVAIAARREEQARALISQFPDLDSCLRRVGYHPASISGLLPTLDLIVNTTPVGMSPEVEDSPWHTNLPFPSCAAVYDLVYNPGETMLVRDARSAGLPATTGIGMLIEQAALAFKIWTGYDPQREVLVKNILLSENWSSNVTFPHRRRISWPCSDNHPGGHARWPAN